MYLHIGQRLAIGLGRIQQQMLDLLFLAHIAVPRYCDTGASLTTYKQWQLASEKHVVTD